MLVLPTLLAAVLAAGADDADRFPLPVDPQRGVAHRFQPSEETALFLFELRGVPVGTVELRVDRSEGRYVYRSRHLYARAQDKTWVSRTGGFTVDRTFRIKGEDAFPESLWLWRKPATTGCVKIREELGARLGEACASEVRADEVRGTLYGDAYTAHYADGWLLSLEVGGGKFLAVPPSTEVESDDVFGGGFSVSGKPKGALALKPTRASPELTASLTRWDEAEARALAAEVHREFVEKRPTSQDFRPGSVEEEVFAGSCLAHAKRFAAKAQARGQRVALVHGLLVEDGEDRAFPHAWIRVRVGWRQTVDLDPTFLMPVKPQTHLPVYAALPSQGDQAAGKVWLDLLAGRYQVTRGLGHP